MSVAFHEIPNYGDLMSLQEFREHVRSGMFIDSDGCGYFATATQESDVQARPSVIRSKLGVPEWATHVVWYNN